MVIEDEEGVARALGELVKHFGHALAGCHGSAAAALAACEHELPDAAVVDFGLAEGTDGLIVTRHLASRHGVRVIVIGGPPAARTVFEAGACVFLRTPFDAAQFERALSCAATGVDAYLA
jgi:ActR/RegA family two-component response regulator